MSTRVSIQTQGLDRLQAGLARTGSSAPMRTMFVQWAKRYEGFTRRRFVTYSRGGGTWAPLAQSTIDARRTGGKYRKYGPNRAQAAREIRSRLARTTNAKRAATLTRDLKHVTGSKGVAILRDLGILFNALSIGTTGNLLQQIPDGIRYGFADAPHNGSPRTIAKIAGYHQTGTRHMPARPILAQPDEQTVRGMVSDLGRAVRALAAGGAS